MSVFFNVENQLVIRNNEKKSVLNKNLRIYETNNQQSVVVNQNKRGERESGDKQNGNFKVNFPVSSHSQPGIQLLPSNYERLKKMAVAGLTIPDAMADGRRQ